MAEIIQAKVNSIKPDPEQPRTTIDLNRVKEMAESMKTEGVIKPIEIDNKNTIVTGEMRWRAAKEAGLATIPCIRTEVQGRDRYRRQLIENLHNQTMSSIDTAVAIRKLLEGDETVENRIKLRKEIGAARYFIEEHLQILTLNKGLQEKIAKNEIPRTITRAVKQVPEEYRQAFQEKILRENLGRDVAVRLASSMNFHPELAESLMGKNLGGLITKDALRWLDGEAPSLSHHMESQHQVENEFHSHIKALIRWTEKHDIDDIGPIYKSLIKSDLRLLSKSVAKWAENNLLSESAKQIHAGEVISVLSRAEEEDQGVD